MRYHCHSIGHSVARSEIDINTSTSKPISTDYYQLSKKKIVIKFMITILQLELRVSPSK